MKKIILFPAIILLMTSCFEKNEARDLEHSWRDAVATSRTNGMSREQWKTAQRDKESMKQVDLTNLDADPHTEHIIYHVLENGQIARVRILEDGHDILELDSIVTNKKGTILYQLKMINPILFENQ
jgi:hypothetical protein